MIAAIESLNSLLNVDSPGKFFVILTLIVGVAAVAITTVVQLSALSIHKAELDFKRDLVERGLSVDEIERIMSMKPMGKSKLSCRKPADADARSSRA